MKKKDLDRIVEGQPLHLKLLRRLLEAAGDPDRGLPVGDPLRGAATMAPGQPSLEPGLRWVPNYNSVEEHVDFARAKFE